MSYTSTANTRHTEYDNHHLRTLLSDFIRALSEINANEEVIVEKYISEKKITVPVQAFETIILILQFFSVVKVRQTVEGTSLQPINPTASNFLKSFALYIEKDLPLITNWEGLGPGIEFSKENLLTWGVQFLNLMEHKRAFKLREKTPLRNINILLIIIKAKTDFNDEPHFLFDYSPKAHRYQLIGGYKIDEDKSDLDAVQRLFEKELFLNKFSPEDDYEIVQIHDEIKTEGLSVKNGIYTHYNISLYQAVFKIPTIKLSSKDRWISLQEMIQGVTTDDKSLKSPLDDIPEKEVLIDLLKSLPLSLSAKQQVAKRLEGKKEAVKSKISVVEEYITHEESETLEFKSSMRWDYRMEQINKELEKTIVKTIAGFLNTQDGVLIIGLDDQKKVIGIEKDMETLKKQNEDGYMQYIISLVSSYLGVELCSFLIITFEKYRGKPICIIKMKKSMQPVFTKEGERREFYARFGNTTRQLNAEETYKYIQLNW